MKEEIKLFLQKVAEDEELRHKLMECKSPEEAYAIASSVQDGFTFEEFVAAGQKLQEVHENNQELTDEDLAKAAGGVSTDSIIVSVTSAWTVVSFYVGWMAL